MSDKASQPRPTFHVELLGMKDKGVEASADLMAPGFDEYYDLLDDCGFVLSEKGELDMKVRENMRAMRKLVSISRNFVMAISVKQGDVVIDSVEALWYDRQFDALLFEIGGHVLSGGRLPKETKPS